MLTALKKEVAQGFATQFERRDGYEVFLAELQHLHVVEHVFQAVEPLGVDGAADMEKRFHHKVGTLEEVVAFEGVKVVAVVLCVEAVLPYQFLLFGGFAQKGVSAVLFVKPLLQFLCLVRFLENLLPSILAGNDFGKPLDDGVPVADGASGEQG